MRKIVLLSLAVNFGWAMEGEDNLFDVGKEMTLVALSTPQAKAIGPTSPMPRSPILFGLPDIFAPDSSHSSMFLDQWPSLVESNPSSATSVSSTAKSDDSVVYPVFPSYINDPTPGASKYYFGFGMKPKSQKVNVLLGCSAFADTDDEKSTSSESADGRGSGSSSITSSPSLSSVSEHSLGSAKRDEGAIVRESADTISTLSYRNLTMAKLLDVFQDNNQRGWNSIFGDILGRGESLVRFLLRFYQTHQEWQKSQHSKALIDTMAVHKQISIQLQERVQAVFFWLAYSGNIIKPSKKDLETSEVRGIWYHINGSFHAVLYDTKRTLDESAQKLSDYSADNLIRNIDQKILARISLNTKTFLKQFKNFTEQVGSLPQSPGKPFKMNRRQLSLLDMFDPEKCLRQDQDMESPGTHSSRFGRQDLRGGYVQGEHRGKHSKRGRHR